MPGPTQIRKEAGILLLIDMVDFTPQSKKQGGANTAELSGYFERELRQRAKHRISAALKKEISRVENHL